MCLDFSGDIGEGRVQRDVCRSSVHMSSKGVRVSFSWGGSAFHTYLSVIEWPVRQLLTVKNLPPPLFSEGNFITVHRGCVLSPEGVWPRGVSAPGGCLLLRGSDPGVSAPGGCLLWGGSASDTPPPVNRITDMSKNITWPQLRCSQ